MDVIVDARQAESAERADHRLTLNDLRRQKAFGRGRRGETPSATQVVERWAMKGGAPRAQAIFLPRVRGTERGSWV
jgi:hypothetical protein